MIGVLLRLCGAAEDQSIIQSEKGLSRKSSLSMMTAEITAVTPGPTDIVAFSVAQCAHFLMKAKPGGKMLYHSGDLARDGASDCLVRDRQQYVGLAADFGLLALRMSRIEEKLVALLRHTPRRKPEGYANAGASVRYHTD